MKEGKGASWESSLGQRIGNHRRQDYDDFQSQHPLRAKTLEEAQVGAHLYKRQTRDSMEHPWAFKTPQEAFIQEELDKIIEVGENDEVITLFTSDIDLNELPRDFFKSNMATYDEAIDPKVFLSTSSMQFWIEVADQCICARCSLNTYEE